MIAFNLSILECKLTVGTSCEHGVYAFNLSILECKSLNFYIYYTSISLLISPYWNVNDGTAGRNFRQNKAFNLSILECKYVSDYSTL